MRPPGGCRGEGQEHQPPNTPRQLPRGRPWQLPGAAGACARFGGWGSWPGAAQHMPGSTPGWADCVRAQTQTAKVTSSTPTWAAKVILCAHKCVCAVNCLILHFVRFCVRTQTYKTGAVLLNGTLTMRAARDKVTSWRLAPGVFIIRARHCRILT